MEVHAGEAISPTDTDTWNPVRQPGNVDSGQAQAGMSPGFGQPRKSTLDPGLPPKDKLHIHKKQHFIDNFMLSKHFSKDLLSGKCNNLMSGIFDSAGCNSPPEVDIFGGGWELLPGPLTSADPFRYMSQI